MTNLPPLPSTIFGKSVSTAVWACALAMRFRNRATVSASDREARMAFLSMRAYHTSSAAIFA